MTTYRLMDGVAGRPGSGPSSPTAYTGSFQAGLVFAVTDPAMWFEGFWWWVPTGGDTASQAFCLYSSALQGLSPPGTMLLIPGTTVDSGTLTAGEWNYIPLATPVPISIGSVNGAYSGGQFIATTAWTAVNGFSDTLNQFGTGDTYANGITNGPLGTYGQTSAGDLNEGLNFPGGSTYGVAGDDPTAVQPPVNSDGTYDNFWLDVQVSDTAPAGYSGTYRLYPNRGDGNFSTAPDSSENYVVATEIDLSESCTVSRIWYYSPAGTSQLATRASVWTISTGAETVAVASPSWSGDAASGWVYCDVPGTPTLSAGKYRVSVFNDNEYVDQWSAKDASSAYWDTGEGASGVTWGPVTAPELSAAQNAYEWDGSASGATPPYSSGTQEPGQCTFAQSGVNAFPQLYVDSLAQNYWVDAEFTPVTEVDQDVTGTAAAATVAGGAGTPSGTSGSSSADVTGVAAAVTVQGGTGTLSAGADITGVAAGVTAAGGTGRATKLITINPALLGGTARNTNTWGGSVR